MSEHLSKTEQRQEILKCAKNPHYFINNYVRINDKKQGTLIPFDTYDFQDDLLDDYQEHQHNIILKARQMGISTITASYIAWHTLFDQFKNVLIVATKEDVAQNVIRMAKDHIQRLPEWMKIADFETNNMNSYELSNGSQVKASSTAEDAGRSESLSLLVVDEAAHVDNMDEIWGAVYPTLSETGGSSIVISTPKGVGGFFYNTYTEAREGQNLFNPVEITWDQHPDRDEEWLEEQKKNMERRKVAQEYETSFLSSGHTVIDPDDIERIDDDNVQEPVAKENFDRNLWIWEPPLHMKENEDVRYYITADVARGDGEDYSAFHVIEANEYKQVAEYKGQLEHDRYAKLLKDTGEKYGECLIIIETNKMGYSVAKELSELGYGNIFYSKKGTHEQVPQHVAESKNQRNIVPGVTTTQNNRPRMISEMERGIRNQAIEIKSERTLNEMRTFVWENGKPQAMEGSNDDLMMALAIGCWARDQIVIKQQNSMEKKKAILKGVSAEKKTFSTSFDDQLNRTPPGLGPEVQRNTDKLEKKKEEAKEQHKEYKWLYTG